MNEPHFRFAGWFTLDVRMVAALLVFSAALAVLVLAVRYKGRRWDEHVVGFLAVFSVCFAVSLGVTNWIAANPALRVETLFAVP